MASTHTRKSDKLSAAKTALILLDVITDFEFEDGDVLLKHTRAMAPHLTRLAERARKAKVPVIYVR